MHCATSSRRSAIRYFDCGREASPIANAVTPATRPFGVAVVQGPSGPSARALPLAIRTLSRSSQKSCACGVATNSHRRQCSSLHRRTARSADQGAGCGTGGMGETEGLGGGETRRAPSAPTDFMAPDRCGSGQPVNGVDPAPTALTSAPRRLLRHARRVSGRGAKSARGWRARDTARPDR